VTFQAELWFIIREQAHPRVVVNTVTTAAIHLASSMGITLQVVSAMKTRMAREANRGCLGWALLGWIDGQVVRIIQVGAVCVDMTSEARYHRFVDRQIMTAAH
jgi:hypothetical protein